jgi:hypothetical protein
MNKKELVFCFSIFWSILFASSFVLGEVRINEVMYDPENNTNSINEWIEIYSSESLNLTSYKIKVKGYEDILYNCSNPNSQIIIAANTFFVIVSNTSYNINSSEILALCNFKNKISSYGLANDWSNLSLLNSMGEAISSFNYTSSLGAKGNGKSLQYCSNNWTENPPTPGQPNNCTTPSQTCTQNWSCTNWGACSEGRQTRTCTDINKCSNITGKPLENQTCIAEEKEDNEIYIRLDWNEESIINGNEFEINVKAYNLKNKDYDVLVEIEDDEGKTISERYGKYGTNKSNVWKSSTFYALEFFYDGGDESADMKLRIDSEYNDFSGDVTIVARIRENEKTAIIDEIDKQIRILASGEDNMIKINDSQTLTNLTDKSNDGNSIIKLVSKTSKTEDIKTEKSTIYKSKNEYMKEYALYGFSILCLFLIILFLIDKK